MEEREYSLEWRHKRTRLRVQEDCLHKEKNQGNEICTLWPTFSMTNLTIDVYTGDRCTTAVVKALLQHNRAAEVDKDELSRSRQASIGE